MNYTIYAFELGNELTGNTGIESHLTVEEYTKSFCELNDIIKDIWTEQSTRPKIIGVDNNFEQAWYSDFLSLSFANGCGPEAVTWHQYLLGAGVDVAAEAKATDPNTLDQQINHGKAVRTAVQLSTPDGEAQPEIWVGEAGGAYNSGRRGTTDSYRSSFWYLDGLAVLATQGHQTFCRQTLIGGNYGLLNTTTYEPNPDYWGVLLWQRLMGRSVFEVAVDGDNADRELRSYSHCHPDGDKMTMLVINLSDEASYELIVAGDYVKRTDYLMTATSLESQSVMLNGETLGMPVGGEVELVGVENEDFGAIEMAPLTYGYYVFEMSNGERCDGGLV
jgi:heparanase 1